MGYFKNMQLIADEITGFVEAARYDQLDDYAHYHNYPAKRRVTIDAAGNLETIDGTIFRIDPVRIFVPDDFFDLHVRVFALPKRKDEAKALVPFLNANSSYATYDALDYSSHNNNRSNTSLQC